MTPHGAAAQSAAAAQKSLADERRAARSLPGSAPAEILKSFGRRRLGARGTTPFRARSGVPGNHWFRGRSTSAYSPRRGPRSRPCLSSCRSSCARRAIMPGSSRANSTARLNSGSRPIRRSSPMSLTREGASPLAVRCSAGIRPAWNNRTVPLGEKFLRDLIGQPQALLAAQLGPGRLRCSGARKAASNGTLCWYG